MCVCACDQLKEVEDEIVLKSGEIRVLRDSLKAAQQEKEAQRQSQIQLETQRRQSDKDKEKELNRMVQDKPQSFIHTVHTVCSSE